MHGTELNGELVRQARQTGYRAVSAAELGSYADNSFDLVVEIDVFEHVPESELISLISEIRRVLKNEGGLIARFPNGDSPFGLPYQNGDPTHATTIGIGKVRYLADACYMKLIFVGGEALPVWGVELPFLVHRMITWLIKKVINFLVRYIFFPRIKVVFCSSNLTAVMKKIDDPRAQNLCRSRTLGFEF